MNIFELYLDKIKSIIIDLNKKGKLNIPETFDGINAEIPPAKFDCDISTNVAMVLSKLNKKSPLDLAEQISPIIKENDSLVDTIAIVKPGFINIKFKPLFWTNFIEEVITNAKTFGINKKEKKT
jgi:arginyl-tRNA synthetase